MQQTRQTKRSSDSSLVPSLYFERVQKIWADNGKFNNNLAGAQKTFDKFTTGKNYHEFYVKVCEKYRVTPQAEIDTSPTSPRGAQSPRHSQAERQVWTDVLAGGKGRLAQINDALVLEYEDLLARYDEMKSRMVELGSDLQQNSTILEAEKLAKKKLEEVKAKISGLDHQTWAEVKHMKTPPAVFHHVTAGVLALIGQKDLSWIKCRKFLVDKNCKPQIINFDPKTVKRADLQRVRAWMKKHDASFDETRAKKASKIAEVLCIWLKTCMDLIAMHENANKELAQNGTSMEELMRKQAEYERLESKVGDFGIEVAPEEWQNGLNQLKRCMDVLATADQQLNGMRRVLDDHKVANKAHPSRKRWLQRKDGFLSDKHAEAYDTAAKRLAANLGGLGEAKTEMQKSCQVLEEWIMQLERCYKLFGSLEAEQRGFVGLSRESWTAFTRALEISDLTADDYGEIFEACGAGAGNFNSLKFDAFCEGCLRIAVKAWSDSAGESLGSSECFERLCSDNLVKCLGEWEVEAVMDQAHKLGSNFRETIDKVFGKYSGRSPVPLAGRDTPNKIYTGLDHSDEICYMSYNNFKIYMRALLQAAQEGKSGAVEPPSPKFQLEVFYLSRNVFECVGDSNEIHRHEFDELLVRLANHIVVSQQEAGKELTLAQKIKVLAGWMRLVK